jgi:hypothetical protein
MQCSKEAPVDYPTRFVRLAEARARHGTRVDRLGQFFWHGDTLADDAVKELGHSSPRSRDDLVDGCLHDREDALRAAPALKRMVDSMRETPAWFDLDRCGRGGEAFLRTAFFGGFVLNFGALPGSYCSPAGNKPLTFTQRLTADVARRLAETGQFVRTVCQRGALAPGAEGFRATVKVRLMHAQVRQLLLGSDRWHSDRWGVPINQVDMAGTVLVFSHAVLIGLDRLGVRTRPDEREDLLHLWRCAGWLLGVDPELLCERQAAADALWDLIASTQEPADDDSRRLVAAFLEYALTQLAPNARPSLVSAIDAMARGSVRLMLGEEHAAALRLAPTRWEAAVSAATGLLARVHRTLRAVPAGDSALLSVGQRYWDFAVGRACAGLSASYGMPQALGIVPHQV